ncbi:MAG: hypothetical protein RLZZ129_638, partial [Verrucomicrobiota bacterium]
ASALTSLKAERDRLSFKYGKALANWDRSLTRAETAERERDAEAAKALSNLEAMLAAENLAAEAILERDEARAEVERLRSFRDRVFNNRLGFTFEPTQERVTIYFDGHRSFEICQQQADLVRQMLSIGSGDYELVPWFEEDDPPHSGRPQQTISAALAKGGADGDA